MKESAWGYLILSLGVAIIAIMLLLQNLTSTSEEDFYLTREVLEASMYDAVDYGTYATSGKLVMSEQKFVEVFLRRFAESVANNRTYKINFYDIHEYPPKATVLVTTDTGETKVSSDSVNININTFQTAILETVSSYNVNMKISKLTIGYNDTNPKSVEPRPFTCGESVIMTVKFAEENDSCNIYKNTEGKFVKVDKDDIKNRVDISNKVEYCSVKLESDPTIQYKIEKSALMKKADYDNNYDNTEMKAENCNK